MGERWVKIPKHMVADMDLPENIYWNLEESANKFASIRKNASDRNLGSRPLVAVEKDGEGLRIFQRDAQDNGRGEARPTTEGTT